MTWGHVQSEVHQDHSVRKNLYHKLERQLGGKVRVVSFFTSFTWPVLIQDEDVDILEEILRNMELGDKELVVVLNSPGGEALPAERIVNVCRSFSGNKFSVIVPRMAKSAATMICFGARKIRMSKTSELGPIDPQIAIQDEDGMPMKYLAAHEIIESYDDLMRRANKTKGRIEPFLQQLARFDARDIRRIVSAQKLSESIAVKCLAADVMAGKTQSEIKQKIRPFLDPKSTVDHGRPIYHDLAAQCGLPIEVHELKDPMWETVWQIYVRLNHFVSGGRSTIAKAMESSEDSYSAGISLPQR